MLFRSKANSPGAISKREDGIVIIDPEKAKGRKDLVNACPYGHIWWNDELQIPQAWPFDAHLIDRGWKAPRAVEVCATRAITALKIDDAAMAARASPRLMTRFGPMKLCCAIASSIVRIALSGSYDTRMRAAASRQASRVSPATKIGRAHV